MLVTMGRHGEITLLRPRFTSFRTLAHHADRIEEFFCNPALAAIPERKRRARSAIELRSGFVLFPVRSLPYLGYAH